jgi:hypothetical protein
MSLFGEARSGRVEQFQVLPKPVAAELLEHAAAAAV